MTFDHKAMARDIAVLREALDYNPTTGHLTWKARPVGHFLKASGAKTFNKRCANTVITTKNGCGYVVVKIFGVKFQAHRVAWALHYGAWPRLFLDHINHDRSDNRISNLREVSVGENSRNQRPSPRNTSGHIGVTWSKRRKKWHAQIACEGQQINIGLYADFAEAVTARKAAEARLGFHENHGKPTTLTGAA